MFTGLKNRIRNIPRPLLVVAAIFLVMGAIAAFAEEKLTENQRTWTPEGGGENGDKYPVPSGYDYDGVDRKYAYMTFAKFSYKIKLGGGAEAVRTIDTMYVPSFDHHFGEDEKYYDTGQAAAPTGEVSGALKDSFFDPLNWPLVTANNGAKYYDMSDRPGGWKDEVGSSEWNRNTEFYKKDISVIRRSDAADDSYAESDMNRDPDTESTYSDPQRVKDGDGSSSRPADVGYVHRRCVTATLFLTNLDKT